MTMLLEPPIRAEYERAIEAGPGGALARPAPLSSRITGLSWLRKGLVLLVLAMLWEGLGRWQDNDLLLPTFLQTAAALWRGLVSGELLANIAVSLSVVLQGYLAGIVLAFALTALAVSTRIGRDLLETLTSMFNPLPAIALLPLALLWFGLGQNRDRKSVV